MTKLLDKALERVRSWPQDRQDDAARLLLAMERRDSRPYKLTPEQRAEVRAALEEVERGEIVSDEDMAAFWKKLDRR